jgi:hypothetical protein
MGNIGGQMQKPVYIDYVYENATIMVLYPITIRRAFAT